MGAVATGIASPLWVESMPPATWTRALSFDPSIPGILVLMAVVVGTLAGVHVLWRLESNVATIAVAFTGSAALNQADAQALGGFVFALASLVLLLSPPVARYEATRLGRPLR